MKNQIVTFRLLLLAVIGFLLPNLAIGQTALVQIIHNSPDPRNDTVDVWVGNTKLIDNLRYQNSYPFVPVPANTRIEVRISDYNSTDTSSTFRKYFQAYTFAPNSRQAIVALGNVSPAITNASNAFRLLLVPNLRRRSTVAGVSQAVAVHGIPDGPTIDGVLRGTGIRIADNMSFGESQGYHELITNPGFADLMDTTATTRLLSAGIDFSAVPDTMAFIILASGYMRLPSGANSTRATRIMAVLPNGLVLAPNLTASVGARVQIIHNAIVASDSIAVWVNGVRETTLQYRKATNYVARTTSGNTAIHITSVNASDTSQAIYRSNIRFVAGKQYQIFTAGLENATGVVNPDGQAGTLKYLNVSSSELSSTDGYVDVKVIHGSVDVGTIDIRVAGINSVLVDNLQYGSAANYFSVQAANFPLEITNADGTVVIGRFTLNLNGLAGKSVSIIASGLISPLNNNQPSFALVVVKADGSTSQVVPTYPTAYIQVIHNSADAAAAQVDVYLNGQIALDNFSFRSATGFVPVPAAHNIRVVIAPSSSSSAADGIYTANYTLAENSKTILVATGLITPNNYLPNPNGVSTAFRLAVVPNAHVGIPSRFNSKRAFVMGITDMPTTGIITYMPTSVISPDTLQFGERLNFDGVNSQQPFRLTLDTNLLYSALPNSVDTSCVVIASGFYNATGNQASNPLQFLQINSNGGIFVLNRNNIGVPINMDFAKVQLIHNCADTLAASVDVYLDGMRMFPGLGYRSASSMDYASAGVPFRVAIAPAGSTSVRQAIDSILVTFEANKKYVVLVEGLVTPNNYRPNPNGLSTALKMRVIKLDDTSRVAGQTKLAVIHSSTDAPTVGLNVSPSGSVLIPDTLNYGENTQYLTLAAQSTSFYLSPLPNLVYTAPLNAFSDSAIVVLASGFLNNVGNQASKPFSLLAITEGGRVIPLPVVNSTKALQLKGGLVAYPNPVDNGVLHLKVATEQNSAYQVRVLNTNGSVMYSKDLGKLSTSNVDLSLPANFASGMYILQLINQTGASTSVKFSVK